MCFKEKGAVSQHKHSRSSFTPAFPARCASSGGHTPPPPRLCEHQESEDQEWTEDRWQQAMGLRLTGTQDVLNAVQTCLHKEQQRILAVA